MIDNVIFRLVEPLDSDNPSVLSIDDIVTLIAQGVVEYSGGSDRIEEVITEANCVVLPTFYKAVLPRILLEVLAMGKPIISQVVPMQSRTERKAVKEFNQQLKILFYEAAICAIS